MSTSRSPLDAVTFDCWNTLIHERDEAAARARRAERLAACAGCGAENAALVFAQVADEHQRQWRAGVQTGPVEIAGWALRALNVESPERVRALAQAWAEVGIEDGASMLPGALETLERLERRGVRRALICDTGFNPSPVVRRLLARHGLLERLEVVVFSDEVGVPKPHPRMFELALGPLGVAPARALHVGDLLPTDVGGARAFGMRSVRLRACYDDKGPEPEADHVADSHAELLALLALD